MNESQDRSELFSAPNGGARRRNRQSANPSSSQQQQQRGGDDSTQVSRSLQRTRAMLRNELDRVGSVRSTIDEDKRAIERGE